MVLETVNYSRMANVLQKLTYISYNQYLCNKTHRTQGRDDASHNLYICMIITFLVINSS